MLTKLSLTRHWHSAPAARGFSMIEVLVTLLVISLALLGTAGLQAYAMRMGQGAQFRTLAVVLAADLSERMEANKSLAMTGAYEVPTTQGAAYLASSATPSSACSNADCSESDLAAYDLSQWQSAIVSNLPQSSWSVVRAVEASTGVNTYTITIGWVDRLENTSVRTYNVKSSVGINQAGTGERFFYTATRTLMN